MHPLKELQSGERGEPKSSRRKGFFCYMTVSKKNWIQGVSGVFHFPARLPFAVHPSNPLDFSTSGVPELQLSDKFRKYWELSVFGFKGCIFILSLPQMLNEDLIQIVLWSELPGQCAVWDRGSGNPAAGVRLYFPWERPAHLGQCRLYTRFWTLFLVTDICSLAGVKGIFCRWCLMEKHWQAATETKPQFFLIFHYFMNIKVCENSVFIWGNVKVALWVISSEVIII